jgi:hypothetical protein
LARRAYEVTQNGYVGTVRTDSASIYRESQSLGEIEVNAGIIKFRQTEPCGGLHTIHAGWIHGARRAVALPRATSQFVKLLPVAFVPSVHRQVRPHLLPWMLTLMVRFAMRLCPISSGCALTIESVHTFHILPEQQVKPISEPNVSNP